jgi:hypothetical protein
MNTTPEGLAFLNFAEQCGHDGTRDALRQVMGMDVPGTAGPFKWIDEEAMVVLQRYGGWNLPNDPIIAEGNHYKLTRIPTVSDLLEMKGEYPGEWHLAVNEIVEDGNIIDDMGRLNVAMPIQHRFIWSDGSDRFPGQGNPMAKKRSPLWRIAAVVFACMTVASLFAMYILGTEGLWLNYFNWSFNLSLMLVCTVDFWRGTAGQPLFLKPRKGGAHV